MNIWISMVITLADTWGLLVNWVLKIPKLVNNAWKDVYNYRVIKIAFEDKNLEELVSLVNQKF